MGYILLLMATLAWSFVGLLVKAASEMVDSTIITFARFSFGVVFLGVFLFFRNGKVQLRANMLWIWLGALGKGCNYFFENMAISMGYSYGNILVPPIQTVTLLLITAIWFKEYISPRGWTAAALCMAGVLVISWNGQPLGLLWGGGGNGITALLFFISAIGAAIHVLSQKILVKSMDNGTMNFSVFMWASVLMALPIPVQSAGFVGPVTLGAWVALIVLGVITGLSFYWFAESLRRVPFAMVAIISNSMVLFSILWAALFMDEPITNYILAGTGVFLVGLLLLNVPSRSARVKVRDDL
ncbi:DMT family transporter [Paenibacillaceae bacterium]|nr:DMT family transporter [Paenibacillaceae bacterium]